MGLSLLVFSAGQNQVSIEEPFKTQESKYAAPRPEIKMSTLQINRLETETQLSIIVPRAHSIILHCTAKQQPQS